MHQTSEMCPCGEPLPYQECCGPLHQQQRSATSAKNLMRSRYCAFCVGEVDYLLQTLAPEKRRDGDRTDIQHIVDKTQWLGLKIIRVEAGDEEDDQGLVEFCAFFNDQGIRQLHEISQFEKRDGKWLYVGGDLLSAVKIGRNDACFCGSGRKFKKCHGA